MNNLADLDIPSIIDQWNQTQKSPYLVTIKRPATPLAKSTYEYKFKLSSESENDVNAPSNYRGELEIRKVLTSEGGMNRANEKVINKFQLIYVSDIRYVMIVDVLNEFIPLINPIVLVCEYRALRNRWVIVGSFKDLTAVFTMNTYLDGFGIWAWLLSQESRIEFSAHPLEMIIDHSWGGLSLCQGKMEDGNCVNQLEMMRRIQNNNNASHNDRKTNNGYKRRSRSNSLNSTLDESNESLASTLMQPVKSRSTVEPNKAKITTPNNNTELFSLLESNSGPTSAKVPRNVPSSNNNMRTPSFETQK